VSVPKAEPKRWVIERTLAWLNRSRRLAKDFEITVASAEAWIMLASIRVLSRRLARASTRRATHFQQVDDVLE
jgi:putative transposase